MTSRQEAQRAPFLQPHNQYTAFYDLQPESTAGPILTTPQPVHSTANRQACNIQLDISVILIRNIGSWKSQ